MLMEWTVNEKYEITKVHRKRTGGDASSGKECLWVGVSLELQVSQVQWDLHAQRQNTSLSHESVSQSVASQPQKYHSRVYQQQSPFCKSRESPKV